MVHILISLAFKAVFPASMRQLSVKHCTALYCTAQHCSALRNTALLLYVLLGSVRHAF